MENTEYYLKVIASLESKVDLLEAELIYLDKILTHCGFSNGIATLKEIVEELLREDPELVKVKRKGVL